MSGHHQTRGKKEAVWVRHRLPRSRGSGRGQGQGRGPARSFVCGHHFVCLSLSVYVSVCLPVCLSVCLCLSISVSLSLSSPPPLSLINKLTTDDRHFVERTKRRKYISPKRYSSHHRFADITTRRKKILHTFEKQTGRFVFSSNDNLPDCLCQQYCSTLSLSAVLQHIVFVSSIVAHCLCQQYCSTLSLSAVL